MLRPKVRNNLCEIYLTFNNNTAFFDSNKKHFQIKCKLENHCKSGIGIIEYFPISEKYNLDDSNYKLLSAAEKIDRFLNKDIGEVLKHKSYIFEYLERESNQTIKVTDDTVMFYLCFYFKQRGFKVNERLLQSVMSTTKKRDKHTLSDKVVYFMS